jgi:AcrR family transcriptional regulator
MANRNVGKPKSSGISYDDRKLEVLTTAARLFNARGYHNTTMDDIASALGVTKPALYYYAKSKDEVLFEVNKHAVEGAQTTMLALNEEGASGAERLRLFFEAWAKHVCGEFGRCLIQTRPKSLAPSTRKQNISARRSLQNEIVDVIAAGVEDGSIRACDPKLMAVALFDLFNGIAYWLNPQGRYSVEEVTDIYWNTLVRGLLSDPT